MPPSSGGAAHYTKKEEPDPGPDKTRPDLDPRLNRSPKLKKIKREQLICEQVLLSEALEFHPTTP